MRILSLHIDGFGKLHNLDLQFAEGLNGIYGSNESGKSTLMAFIRAMLYGMSAKSSSVSQNMRKKYMPWDGSPFGGSLFLQEGGEQYEITRTFAAAKKGDTLRVLNRNSGEVLPLSPGQEPGELLLHLPEAVFLSTLHISSGGAVLSDGEALSDRMQNLVSTGQEDVALKQVVSRLHSARLALDSSRGKGGELCALQEQLTEARRQMAEGGKREERLREIEKELKALDAEKEAAQNPYQKETLQQLLQIREEMECERLPSGGVLFLVLGLLMLAGGIALGLLYNLLGFGMLLPAGLLLALYFVKQNRRKSEEYALNQDKEEIGEEISRLEGYLRDSAAENDIDGKILTLKIERGTLLNAGTAQQAQTNLSALEGREKELQQKIAALTLAEQTLTELGQIRSRSLTPHLSARMAALLPALTDGRYRDTAIDGKLRVSLQGDGGALRSYEYLSSGATEQTYLALRLALCDLLADSLHTTLPLTLDDPFVLYDTARRAQAHKVLSDYATKGWQILLFTCRRDDLPPRCHGITL